MLKSMSLGKPRQKNQKSEPSLGSLGKIWPKFINK